MKYEFSVNKNRCKFWKYASGPYKKKDKFCWHGTCCNITKDNIRCNYAEREGRECQYHFTPHLSSINYYGCTGVPK